MQLKNKVGSQDERVIFVEQQFEKIMQVTKRRADGTAFCPVHLNHVREICYGRSWDESPINEYELCIHVEGQTALYIGEQVYYPTRGTVASFKAGEVHMQFVTSLDPYERFILWFDYDCLSQLFDGVDHSLLRMFTDREMFKDNVVQLPPHESSRLIATLTKAAAYCESEEPERDGLFYAAVLKALAIINKGYCTEIEKQNSGNYSPIVSMALEIVERQFVELQCVEELSAQLNISNSYLARIFKKQVGTSVYEYIQNMKLANSVKMLADGKTVTEACYDSGFNNYSYFIQLFKRKYGITPRKYQRSLEI